MTAQNRDKQERIIEAVRQGLEGDAAVEFILKSGHAATSGSIVHHLRLLGGRARVLQHIAEGKSNLEILEICSPGEDLERLRRERATQGELFPHDAVPRAEDLPGQADVPLYEMAKITLRIPADVYEALRIASKAEHKTQNELVTEILTTALARLPVQPSNKS